MDNWELKNKNINVPPMVHLFPEFKDIRGTDVLLISSKEGVKGKISYEDFLALVKAEILKGLPKQDLIVNVTMNDIINAFKDQNSINFVKPINILHNKSIEKDNKDVGSFYFDGERPRLCTKKGWKTLIFNQ